MGIDLDRVCKLNLKDVKELKQQKERKGSEYVWFDEEVNSDSFDVWTFEQEPHQVLHSRVFWEKWIGYFS